MEQLEVSGTTGGNAKIVQPLQKIVWHIPIKLNIYFPHLAILLLGIFWDEMDLYSHKKPDLKATYCVTLGHSGKGKTIEAENSTSQGLGDDYKGQHKGIWGMGWGRISQNFILIVVTWLYMFIKTYWTMYSKGWI